VLEGLPGAEVGGEREGPDQLGRANRLLRPRTGLLDRDGRHLHVLYTPMELCEVLDLQALSPA